MAKNPFYDPNPAAWWHGDEEFLGKDATLEDAWSTWETGAVDCDGWGIDDWIDDIRHSDFLGDMDRKEIHQLLTMIAVNRNDERFKDLVQYATQHIQITLEG